MDPNPGIVWTRADKAVVPPGAWLTGSEGTHGLLTGDRAGVESRQGRLGTESQKSRSELPKSILHQARICPEEGGRAKLKVQCQFHSFVHQILVEHPPCD